jgi:hypothetical protein
MTIDCYLCKAPATRRCDSCEEPLCDRHWPEDPDAKQCRPCDYVDGLVFSRARTEPTGEQR